MTRVLVPVAVLEGESVSPGLVDLLGTVDVTVLGYHVLPEQTPPDQARLQYEDRATDALEDLSDAFRTAGGAADHRLVFTHDRQQSIDRIADEVDAKALAVPGITGDVERVLVSLSGDVAVDRILSFLTELVGDRDIGVTLLFAADTEDAAAERLDTAAEQLRSSGIDVTTTSVVGTGPSAALIEEASSHDAIVMSERAPSFSSLIFGEESDRIAAASVGPVLVVRYEEGLDT
ncbi:universal stress protein [Haloarcula laminariae]|uniref:universal stress protein n=1 Tax=Haloarcula laminariae TaxID=2961577 RepID=UPI0021C9045C|nr:universal stress protein [Halomicroarcula laminariae]